MRKFYCFIVLLLLAFYGSAQKNKAPEEEIFACVLMETYSRFPGGNAAWLKYIQKNNKLDSIYQSIAENTKPWKAEVSFIIDRSGSIEVTGIKSDSIINNAYLAELRRLITQSPKWSPAMQNGRARKDYRVQTIVFIPEEEDEEKEIRTQTDASGRKIPVTQ